jgi:hypothetical protein
MIAFLGNAYWSARLSTTSLISCSGAAYAKLPTVMFVVVKPFTSVE